MGWAEEEFETLDLGDTWLNRRAVLLAERLSQSLGRAYRGMCELERDGGGVPVLDNERVTGTT